MKFCIHIELLSYVFESYESHRLTDVLPTELFSFITNAIQIICLRRLILFLRHNVQNVTRTLLSFPKKVISTV